MSMQQGVDKTLTAFGIGGTDERDGDLIEM